MPAPCRRDAPFPMLPVEVLTMLPLPHATSMQVEAAQAAWERQAQLGRLANEAGVRWSLRERLAAALYHAAQRLAPAAVPYRHAKRSQEGVSVKT